MKFILLPAVLIFSFVFSAFAENGASVYTSRLDDARAIYLSDAVGDGKADDTAAIQAAIDKAFADRKAGIVFIPEGRYRLTRTIHLHPSVRLVGWGAKRPTFVLADNTPGYAKGIAYMVMFVGALPNTVPPRETPFFPPVGSVPPTDKYGDANPGTFFSAMSNINFEIGEGNAAAVGIRFHGAQHNFLKHMDFHIGSGLAGVYHVANEGEDLRFFGGRYGILAEKPSAAWQLTLIDSVFDGQRDAAIREHEASLTLINVTFRNLPVGIDIDPEYTDWLWAKNTRFENISKAAVMVSAENNVYNQIGFENAIANNVPVFARYRESGKTLGGKGIYEVKNFNHGIILNAPGTIGDIGTRYDAVPLTAMPAAVPRAIRALPPTNEWVNVKTLGAKGDGNTDDTEALQQAITSHRVLYLPSGNYVVTDTLTLKPDTIVLGLHPSITRVDLPDLTPAYQGVGAPKALLLTPQGGDNIVIGIGLSTGGINARAVGAFWQAGENSLLNDVFFPGGHGTSNPDGTRWNPYNANRTGDADPAKRWDGQYASLWVTNGGGGTFVNLWTPSTYAQAGMLVSDTKTPGRVYQVSNEHHVRTEFALRNVENWDFYAAQTEEESGESREALSFEIHNSRNITLANLHSYRVTRSLGPMDTAVRIFNSSDIRFRNVHVNAESGLAMCDQNGCGTHLRPSKYPYENAIRDASNHVDVREREFALLDFNQSSTNPSGTGPNKAKPSDMGAKVEKLEEGFFSISGAAVDAKGKLYFVDRHQQRIFGYAQDEGLTIERDQPFDPVNLAFDRSGNLMVVSWIGQEGTVYSFKPGSPATELTVIAPTPTKARRDAQVILPVNYWNNGEFRDQLNIQTYQFTTFSQMFARDLKAPQAKAFVSVDGSTVIPAWRTFQQGPSDHMGWRFSANLDTYGFTQAKPGERIYFINSSEARTYSGKVNADGSITDLKFFADRGGESLAVDHKGNVYLANGQILAYDKKGKRIGQIDVPDRPIQIILGGADKRTLFILTHRSLYSVKI